MLLRIFKTSQPLSWILIITIITIFRAILFLATDTELHSTENETFTSYFTLQFANSIPWLSHLVSTLIILFSGLFFNKIVQNLNILEGIHYLLLLFFGIFISFNPENLLFTPFILSAPFSLFSLNLILSQPKGNVSLANIFNASFFIGFSTIIYFPSVALFPILIISLFYLNQAKWRYFSVSIIGLLTPWLFNDAIIYSFAINQNLLFSDWMNNFSSFQIANFFPIYTTILFIALMTFQSYFYVRALSKSIIKIRKTLFLILVYLVLGVVLTGFIQNQSASLFNLVLFPTSLLFTVTHLEIKKWWLSDLLFLILLANFSLSYLNL
jgi:hypothetical protein